jgi:hypothetical protein
MNRILLFFLLGLNNIVFSQIIGDTRSTVKQLHSDIPCDLQKDFLVYCLSNQSKIIYTFNDYGYVYQITRFYNLRSYHEAKNALNKKVLDFKNKHNVEPIVSDGRYTYYYNDSHSITYSNFSNELGFFLVEVEFSADLYQK